MSTFISIPIGENFIQLDKVPYILANIDYKQKNESCDNYIYNDVIKNYKQYLLDLIKNHKIIVVYCDRNDPYKPNNDDYWNLICCLDLPINEFIKICKLLHINVFVDNCSKDKVEKVEEKLIQNKKNIINDSNEFTNKLKKQLLIILSVIENEKYMPMKIQDGKKSIIADLCIKNYSESFKSIDAFDRVWKIGVKNDLFRMENHDSYARRGKT